MIAFRFAVPSIVAVSLVCVLALPVRAAPAGATDTTAARVATDIARTPESTGSLAEAAPADDAGSCIKVRRRLWVEGEGWIVRRVGICR